jgi:hypothetical protein
MTHTPTSVRRRHASGRKKKGADETGMRRYTQSHGKSTDLLKQEDDLPPLSKGTESLDRRDKPENVTS